VDVYVQTFVVVANDMTMFRFTATKSLFVLSPTNIVRRKAILLLCHPYPFRYTALAFTLALVIAATLSVNMR